MPKLADLQLFLSFYSICEKHYNQVVAADHFYQRLLEGLTNKNKNTLDDSIFFQDSSIQIGSSNIQEEVCDLNVHKVYDSSIREEIIANELHLLREFEKAQEILGTLDQKIRE